MAEPEKAVNEAENKWAQVVARAWADDAFRKRLLTQTAAVLGEAGLVPPEGTQFKVVENTERLIHLVLPRAPGEGELSEETLQAITGGADFCIGGCATQGFSCVKPYTNLKHFCISVCKTCANA
jgi:hypothetical protein